MGTGGDVPVSVPIPVLSRIASVCCWRPYAPAMRSWRRPGGSRSSGPQWSNCAVSGHTGRRVGWGHTGLWQVALLVSTIAVHCWSGHTSLGRRPAEGGRASHSGSPALSPGTVGVQLPGLQEYGAAGSSAHDASAAMWACQHCTFMNQPGTGHCEMCSLPRA